jgi:hypothetical protein
MNLVDVLIILIVLAFILVVIYFVTRKSDDHPLEFPADFPDAKWTSRRKRKPRAGDDLKGINKHYK